MLATHSPFQFCLTPASIWGSHHFGRRTRSGISWLWSRVRAFRDPVQSSNLFQSNLFPSQCIPSVRSPQQISLPSAHHSQRILSSVSDPNKAWMLWLRCICGLDTVVIACYFGSFCNHVYATIFTGICRWVNDIFSLTYHCPCNLFFGLWLWGVNRLLTWGRFKIVHLPFIPQPLKYSVNLRSSTCTPISFPCGQQLQLGLLSWSSLWCYWCSMPCGTSSTGCIPTYYVAIHKICNYISDNLNQSQANVGLAISALTLAVEDLQKQTDPTFLTKLCPTGTAISSLVDVLWPYTTKWDWG